MRGRQTESRQRPPSIFLSLIHAQTHMRVLEKNILKHRLSKGSTRRQDELSRAPSPRRAPLGVRELRPPTACAYSPAQSQRSQPAVTDQAGLGWGRCDPAPARVWASECAEHTELLSPGNGLRVPSIRPSKQNPQAKVRPPGHRQLPARAETHEGSRTGARSLREARGCGDSTPSS